jgi:hypothetical protein
MNSEEISQFFAHLGEVWRDITAIEFLMRCAIAKSNKDLEKLPKPPFKKGQIYKDYPTSFAHYSFEIVTKKFNKRFPKICIPEEVIQLRDAMAHGFTAELNKSGVIQLVKFKEVKKELIVEFSLDLKPQTLAQLRQSLMELRRYIMEELAKN